MGVWSVNTDEGFAAGPVEEVIDGDRTVLVSAVWTNEDGVAVSVDAGDEPLPSRMVNKVWAAAAKLAALAGPACVAVCGVAVQASERVFSTV